ncbi:aminotransferase-like domain-containing protein [Colwellia sp. Bg11-28]|uniref:aminotransferase-like domain-containing protein n=1 Tax=Colwellia sp. Bg11-28 TaxID=2058305 RepID=UPI000C325BC8|nr:PLP-dependent aminotransferase family protein [Colwellia sp. Bg11-28]PKH86979.1 transcriptional regulator [Colwellia sp. Bg11-28]
MRYIDLAEMCIADISSGKLVKNSRMPSLRNFRQQHSISMTTALNCYQYLESLGWILARPQSGYFVCGQRMANEKPELVAFKSIMTDPKLPVVKSYYQGDSSSACAVDSSNTSFANHSVYQPANKDIVGPLGVARISTDFIPLDKLQNSFRRALKRQGSNISFYPDIQGEKILRDTLSSHFKSYDFHIPSDELLITNGCMDAIQTAIEICTDIGDAVAISSPCFNGILDMLAALGRKVVEIPSTEQGIDLVQLEQHMKSNQIKAGLFCTSHMNPQGISMTALQKQHLVNLAQTNKIPIIEDDVYIELAHGKVMPLPAKHWDKHGYILWCGSVSKTIAAGYRLGWCWPGRFTEQYLQKRKYCNQGVSSPVQLGLADFISNGDYAKHLKKLRVAIQQHTLSYQRYLTKYLPAASKISDPSGGFVLWIQVPNLNGRKLLQQATEYNIDIRIGEQFSTRDLYQDYFRVNTGFMITEGNDKDTREEVDSQIDKLMKLVKMASSDRI